MSLSSIFQDIADAIRTKTGKSESIYPIDMASEIEGIESGGGYKLEKMPSGAVSSFNDGTDLPLNKLKVSIEPVQDLHGYDNPWAGGAGKNKYPDTQDINLGGTNPRTVNNAISVPIGAGTYCISWKSTGETTPNLQMRIDGVYKSLYSGSSFTVTSSANLCYWFITMADYDANKTARIYDIQIESGSTPSGYEPYSNICPISGWDEVNVTVANDVDNPTISNVYTIDLDGTLYGGTLDVVSGVLTVTNANIVSYNGEIINKPWISSMDVYSAGATPATGAQVVYPLATPQTIQLAPTAVRSLIELNNIWTDTGDIINGEYFKEAGTRPTS